MFDDVRLHVDDARKQVPAVGQRVFREDAVLVFVAGIGFLDGEPTDVEFVEFWEYVHERRVTVVWPLVAPPAGVDANLVVGDVPGGFVERGDVQADDGLELLDGAVAEAAVSGRQQVRGVEVEDGAGVSDGLVLLTEGVADGVDELLVGVVVLVDERRGGDAGGSRGQERPLEVGVDGGERVGERLDFLVDRFRAVVLDGAGD